MKTVKGKIAFTWDIVQVEYCGQLLPLNLASMGSVCYHAGQIIDGIIMNDKFHVCKEYMDAELGPMYGYIVKDDFDSKCVRINVIMDGLQTESPENCMQVCVE